MESLLKTDSLWGFQLLSAKLSFFMFLATVQCVIVVEWSHLKSELLFLLLFVLLRSAKNMFWESFPDSLFWKDALSLQWFWGDYESGLIGTGRSLHFNVFWLDHRVTVETLVDMPVSFGNCVAVSPSALILLASHVTAWAVSLYAHTTSVDVVLENFESSTQTDLEHLYEDAQGTLVIPVPVASGSNNVWTWYRRATWWTKGTKLRKCCKKGRPEGTRYTGRFHRSRKEHNISKENHSADYGGAS